MILGLDFDGVILDIVPLKMTVAAGAPWYLRMSPADVARGDLDRRMEDRGHLDVFEAQVFGRATMHALPVVGVKSALLSLPEKPYLVSARRGLAITFVYAWLAEHELTELFHDIHFVPISRAKDATCAQLGVDTFVDDLEWVLDAMPSVPNRILFDPHNAMPNAPFLRVRSWKETMTLLEHASTPTPSRSQNVCH